MSKPNSGLFHGTSGEQSLRLLKSRLIPGKPGIVSGGKSTVLGKNMLHEMGISRSKKWTGYQAQHIIPAEMKNHPVLQKIGMNLDDSSNGIFLKVPGKNISTQSRHRGYHSIYSEFVRQELNRINIHSDSYSIQKQVLKLQSNLRRLQKSGLPLYSSEGATIELRRKSYHKLK